MLALAGMCWSLALPAADAAPSKRRTEGVELSVSDTLVRLGYAGEDIVYDPSGGGTPRPDGSPGAALERTFALELVRGEREDVQMRLSSDEDPIVLTAVTIDPFVPLDGAGDAVPEADLYLVGDVEGVDFKGGGVGPFPDVLVPLGEREAPYPSHGGIRLLASIHAPRATAPGTYRSSVTMNAADGRTFAVRLEARVANASLPERSRIDTNYFAIDAPSLGYWYGLDPGGEAMAAMIERTATLLFEHRMSLSATPPTDARTPPGRTTRIGPTFEALAEGFELELQLRAEPKASGDVLSHRWYGRPSGYSLALADGTLSLSGWTRPGDPAAPKRDAIEPRKVTLEAPWPKDARWHSIIVGVTSDRWSITADGETRGMIDPGGSIVPAYGGWVTLAAKPGVLQCRDPEWRAVAGPDGRAGVALEPARRSGLAPDRDGLSSKGVGGASSASIAESKGFEHWLNESLDSGEFVNDLRQSTEKQPGPALARAERIGSADVLNRAFVSLPIDEAVAGKGVEINLAFAEKVRAESPGLRRFHTFGAMRGSLRTASGRRRALERYDDAVDIWSMRPAVFFEQRKFFDDARARGDEVSLYIHDVDVVERDDVTLLGRNFFWLIGALDIDRVTFWNTTLWFQPEKKGRPARTIDSTPTGFRVTQRNPAGIGAGTIFYPGRNGPVPSLRSFAWRDGLEEAEMMLSVSERVAAKGSDAGAAAAIERARRLIERRDALYGDVRNTDRVSKKRAADLHALRAELLAVLERL